MTGFILSTNKTRAQQLVKATNTSGWESTLIVKDDKLYIGTCGNNDNNTYHIFSNNAVQYYFMGVVIPKSIHMLETSIITYYCTGDTNFLSQINGYFQLIIADRNANKIILITDRYGLSRFYYTCTEKEFTAGSRFLPLLKTNKLKTLNTSSVREFLNFRYVLGNNTFSKEIEQSGTASIIEYNTETKTIRKQQYWQFNYQENFLLNNDNVALCAKGYEHWQKAVEHNTANLDHVIIPLSGGKDSRAILAASLNCIDTKKITTVSYGNHSSYDLQIARKVARVVGVKNIVIPTETKHFYKQFETVFDLHDGMSAALPSLPFSGFKKLKDIGNTIISGYIGDYIFGSNMHESMHQSNEPANISLNKTPSLFLQAIQFQKPGLVSELLQPEISAGMPDITSELQTIHSSNLANKFVQFFLQNHIYNFTYHTCLAHKNSFSYRTPFLDNNLVDFTLQLPLSERNGQKLYNQMLMKFYPKLFALPIKNEYGMRINTPQWYKNLRYTYWVKNLWRAKRILGLCFGLTNIPPDKSLNYLDYENMLRSNTDFQKYLHNAIINLDEKTFSKEKVLQLYQNHQKKWVNHSHLLAQVITVDHLVKKYFS